MCMSVMLLDMPMHSPVHVPDVTPLYLCLRSTVHVAAAHMRIGHCFAAPLQGYRRQQASTHSCSASGNKLSRPEQDRQ